MNDRQSGKVNVMFSGLIWCAYLLVLSVASFVTDMFPSRAWLLINSAVFALITLHSMIALFDHRLPTIALRRSMPVLIFCALVIIWLFSQTIVPVRTYIHELFLSSELASSGSMTWFEPDFVWSVTPLHTRWLLLSELMMLGVFYLTVVLVTSRRRLYQLLYTFVGVGLIHAILGILAKFSNVSLVDLSQVDGHFTVARGLFVNRNHFAAFLSLTLVGALALQFKYLFRAKGVPWSKALIDQLISPRIIVLLSIFILIIAIALSQSRAGFSGLFVSLLITLIVLGKQARRFGRRRTVVISAAFVFVSIIAYFGHDLLQRFSGDVAFLGERGAQWALTWTTIKQEWLLGYGGNSYATVFQMVREHEQFRQVIYNQAHNDYLHIWLEQGLIGLALWLAIVLFTLINAYRSYIATQSSLVSASLVAASIVTIAALLQSLVDFNLQIINIRFYFFVIIAMVFAVPSVNQRRRPRESKKNKTK